MHGFLGIDIDSYLLEMTPGSCHALVGVWDRFQVLAEESSAVNLVLFHAFS